MTDLPGTPFDVADLKPCASCGQGMAHDGNVAFYEVKVAQCVIDHRNVQRMAGLELMMNGNIALARVFSPDNSVARRLPDVRHLICQTCLLDRPALAVLLEIANG